MTENADRRRAPRVDLVGQLQGELVSVDVPIRVREISLGGMSIEAGQAFTVDERHNFMLTLGDGSGVFVIGRVAYSRKVEVEGETMFIIGIQFMDEDEGDSGDVEDILRNVH